MTYRQFDDNSAALSRLLHDAGLRRGDVVALLSDNAAQDYLRDRIAHFKAPRSVDFVDDLPGTPTGKLAKTKLQQQVTARG